MESRAKKPQGQAIDIHHAVAHNDEESIKQYVEDGGNLDKRDGKNLTPLHIAAAGGFCTVVEFLIKHKAGVDVTSKLRHTPLHLACRFGHLPVVLLLLAEGADLNARDADGNSPLHKAASNGKAQLCREMVKRGAAIDCRNNTDYTPLHWACFKGHKAAAEQLLKCGANIDATSSRRTTSLFMATYYGHVDVTFLLLAWGADVTIADQDGMKPGGIFFPEAPMAQQGQIKILLQERQCLLLKGYEAARRNMALLYMRSERSDLSLLLTQGEVETLWGKLVKREKELNISKTGARDLSHAVKAMKTALEQARNEAKATQERLAALKAEVNEAKEEAQKQHERAVKAERSYAKLLEEKRRTSLSPARSEGAELSPRFQRDLWAGAVRGAGGGDLSSPRVLGLTKLFSKEELPDLKWQANGGQDGRRSPGSSISTPPPILHKVPCTGGSVATVSKKSRAWESALSPAVLTSELPSRGRIAALASRINTCQASAGDGSNDGLDDDNADDDGGDHTNLLSTTDVGPLATAYPSPARTAFALRGRDHSRRSRVKRSSSSVSLPPLPKNKGDGDFSGNGGRRGSESLVGTVPSISGGSRKTIIARSSSSGEGPTLEQDETRDWILSVPRSVPKPGSRTLSTKDGLAAGLQRGGRGRPTAAGAAQCSENSSRSSSVESEDSGFGSTPPASAPAADASNRDTGAQPMPFKQQKRLVIGEGADGGYSAMNGGDIIPASPDKGGGSVMCYHCGIRRTVLSGGGGAEGCVRSREG